MALVQHKDQPTAGTGCRRAVLSSAQQHQILSSLCAMKRFYIARISVDCLSPIICLLGVKLQPAVWAPTAHCLSHGNGLSQALCSAAAMLCTAAHGHAVSLQHISSLSKGFSLERLLLSGRCRGAVLLGQGWAGTAWISPCFPSCPWSCLSAVVHSNIIKHGGSIFACFPPRAAEGCAQCSLLSLRKNKLKKKKLFFFVQRKEEKIRPFS